MNAQSGEIIIPANRKITKTLLRKLASVYDHIEIDPSPIRNKILEIISSFEGRFTELDGDRERRLDQIESGDEIDPGVVKEVKVFVAAKRKLSVGDKMAGRHGNKGVVRSSCRKKTCLTFPMERRLTSASTLLVCPPA